MKVINKKNQDFLKTEFKKVGFKVIQNESGREGIDFVLNTINGMIHNLYLQSIDLNKQQRVKIPKQSLGILNDNLWIALVLILGEFPQGIYVIPSKVFNETDNVIFKSNDTMLEYLSNWEIKVFTSAIPELNKYSIENMVDKL